MSHLVHGVEFRLILELYCLIKFQLRRVELKSSLLKWHGLFVCCRLNHGGQSTLPAFWVPRYTPLFTASD